MRRYGYLLVMMGVLLAGCQHSTMRPVSSVDNGVYGSIGASTGTGRMPQSIGVSGAL